MLKSVPLFAPLGHLGRVFWDSNMLEIGPYCTESTMFYKVSHCPVPYINK